MLYLVVATTSRPNLVFAVALHFLEKEPSPSSPRTIPLSIAIAVAVVVTTTVVERAKRTRNGFECEALAGGLHELRLFWRVRGRREQDAIADGVR